MKTTITIHIESENKNASPQATNDAWLTKRVVEVSKRIIEGSVYAIRSAAISHSLETTHTTILDEEKLTR